MKKLLIVGTLMLALAAGGAGCTNMSRTQQGIASGAALGAAAGLGIAAISGGSAAWGMLAGAGAGALAGGIVGTQAERNHYR